MGKFLILTAVLHCFVTIQAYSDRANKLCYTDKSYVGYKKLYDSSSDLYSNRPKCDAERHFGLTMTFKSNRRSSKSCLQFDRKWWAVQIIPQGKEPIFKFNGYANEELAALDCLNNGNEKKLIIKGLRNTEYKLHDEGEICMSSTQRNFKQKFDVFIITKPLPDDPSPGIQTYQSPRFECQYKSNGPHCVVKHPEDVTCDESF